MMDLQRAAGRAGVGEVAETARRQVVDDVDGLATCQQAVHEVRSDESCPAYDQRLHTRPFSKGSGSQPSCSPSPAELAVSASLRRSPTWPGVQVMNRSSLP